MRRRRQGERPSAGVVPHAPPADRIAHYQALAELARRHGDTSLTASELKVFSQNGEDGVLAEIFRRIGPGARTFAEVGAGDGVESNCVFLADVLGWSGTCIEGDPTLHARLARHHEANPRVRTACRRIGTGDLDGVLEELGCPDEPDLLSIDIDGVDWWIWHGLRRRPRVVVVEYNAARGDAPVTVPADHDAPWDGTDYFGASLPAFELLAAARGYRLVHTDLTGVNAFFVRDDLAGGFPPSEEVPRRAPNFLLAGIALPPDPHGRPWVDVHEALG